jgi:tetratricopeptide (TPR) repeat protein
VGPARAEWLDCRKQAGDRTMLEFNRVAPRRAALSRATDMGDMLKNLSRSQPASARSLRANALDPKNLSYLAILVAAAALPYLNSLFNGFVYDDNRQVLDNPYLRSLRFLPGMFSTNVWSFAGAQGVSNYYRPMMTLGYFICYQLFGPVAYGFHLVNLLLHVGVTLLVFQIARRLFGQDTAALIAALLFALHPVHTESVAWVAAVTDLEVTFFYLLTFWLFLRLPRGQGGRSDRIQLAMVVSFALTILSKEQSLTLPLVATVYEHVYREDRAQTSWSQKVARYGTLWLMDLAYVVFRIRYLGAFAPQQQMSRLTWYETFLSALVLVGKYLGKLLWPVELCAYYVFHKSTSLLDPRVLAGVLGLLVSAGLFCWLWKRQRMPSFGLIWMYATLAPVLDARLLAGNVFAERYLYLPSVGFAWLVGWMAAGLWKAVQSRTFCRWGLAAASAAVALLCVLRIVTRNRDWRSDYVLYTQTLKISPDATHIRNNLGVVCWNQGDIAGAEKEWRLALIFSPHDPIVLSNLGLVYAREKRYRKAARYFRQAMHRKPDYTDPHTNLGNVYKKEGKLAEAELQFRAAVALSPLLPSTHNALAKIYLKEGKFQAAEEQFQASVRDEPNFHGYDGLGDLLMRREDRSAAEQAYHQAVLLNPFDSHAHFALAEIALAEGQDGIALKEYRQGLATDPRNSAALEAVQQLRQHENDGDKSKP